MRAHLLNQNWDGHTDVKASSNPGEVTFGILHWFVDPQAKAKAQDWVEIKHLLEGGFLSAGDELIPVSSTYADVRALVLENGQLEVRGQKFDSPSGAAKTVKGGKQTNGWGFWTVADGRRLKELRTEFMNGAQPWNGRDWYVSFGEYDGGRQWADGAEYGFVSAGGDAWYSDSLRKLPVGARVWAYIPKAGYVGVGTVTGEPRRFDQATVAVEEVETPLARLPLAGNYRHMGDGEDDKAEWVVPVRWVATRSRGDAFWEQGMYANQNSATKLRHQPTLSALMGAFDHQADE